jgi:hypothetical protein
MRKRFVETILYTDMATMKQLREEFQIYLNKINFNGTKEHEKCIVDKTNEQTIEDSK